MTRLKWCGAVLVAAALVGVALGAVRDARANGSAAPGSGCAARPTRTIWLAFVHAFSSGSYRRLDALFAQEPDFVWYSSNVPGLRNGTAAFDRRTLIAYFRARHVQRDRLRSVAFAYHGDGNFTYRLRRSANDYKSGAWFGLIGKGAASCAGGQARLIVVSVGGPGSDRRS